MMRVLACYLCRYNGFEKIKYLTCLNFGVLCQQTRTGRLKYLIQSKSPICYHNYIHAHSHTSFIINSSFLSGTQLAFKYVKECPCLWETTYIYSIYLFVTT